MHTLRVNPFSKPSTLPSIFLMRIKAGSRWGGACSIHKEPQLKNIHKAHTFLLDSEYYILSIQKKNNNWSIINNSWCTSPSLLGEIHKIRDNGKGMVGRWGDGYTHYYIGCKHIDIHYQIKWINLFSSSKKGLQHVFFFIMIFVSSIRTLFFSSAD